MLPQRCPELHVAKRTLNDRLLKSLKPAKTGRRYEVMDSIVSGLGVRVTDKGQRTFMLVARYPGSRNPTRRAIGEYGALSLESARGKARSWLELLQKGIDPRIQQERQRLQEQRRQENSFASVAEQFIRLAVIGPNPKKPKQRKGRVVERELRREFVERWGNRPITDITAHDVIAVLDEAVARGAPYQAHNLLGHVRRLFNWAIARGVYGLDRSPCDRMKPTDVIGKKALRTRVLTDREMRALSHATDGMGYPYGPLFRLLMLTGQRKSEVSDARWSEFDLEQKRWIIPAARMKADAPHVVPLTTEAIAVLKSLPHFDKGEYLFSTTFGEKAVSGFSKAKTRIDELMLAPLRTDADVPEKIQIEHWTIHDIRRTVRTGLSALPIPDLVRELVIAHAKPGLHKVYDQFAYEEEKRRALELWAGRLHTIIGTANISVDLARSPSTHTYTHTGATV
jgi:integrase